MIKNAIVFGICLASSVAYANCQIRSDIKLSRQAVAFGPTDLQRMVIPDGTGKQCTVRYRVNIDDEWQDVEGVGRGKTEDEACTRALDLQKGSLLVEVDPSKVTADTQLVCSDAEEIRVRSVKIGEVIWESEVDLHRNPQERKYFDYKQTKCRMFTERNVKYRNLFTYQGVICKINDSKWRVVDKY